MIAASPSVLAVLFVIVLAGMAWMFRNGGPLHKVTAVAIAGYLVVSVANWSATNGQLHPTTAVDGLQFVVAVAAALAVRRFASWAVPAIIVGCLVVVSIDGARLAAEFLELA